MALATKLGWSPLLAPAAPMWQLVEKAFHMPAWTLLRLLAQWLWQIAHDGMVRPGEVLALRWKDVLSSPS